MLSLKSIDKKSIHFLKSKDTIVYTPATKSLKDFIQQRIRWTSKSSGYRDKDIVGTAIIVALVNITWLVTISLSFTNPVFLKISLIYFIIKSIIDLFLLVPVSVYFRSAHLLIFFPILQIVYPFYISFIAIAGNFSGFQWKGRNLKKQ